MLLFLGLLLVGSVQASFLEIKATDRIELNANNEIELCWLTAKHSKTRNLQIKIENFVSEQFLRADLKISFVGPCLESPRPMDAIGIAFFDDPENSESLNDALGSLVFGNAYPGHPTTYHQGVYVQQNLIEIILSAHLENVRPSLLQQAAPLSAKGMENLFLSIALHEIMHAVGFAHEQNRPDSLCAIEKDTTFHAKSHTLIGGYDSVSIMNPCYTKRFDFENNGPAVLSAGDLKSLRYLYDGQTLSQAAITF